MATCFDRQEVIFKQLKNIKLNDIRNFAVVRYNEGSVFRWYKTRGNTKFETYDE
jgi:hypothetical protein